MARFVVVLPVGELAVGDAFPVAEWPLHVTLVEPFATTRVADEIAAIVGAALGRPLVVATTAGDRQGFGRRRDVPVTLVHDDGALEAMRHRVLSALRDADVDVARARRDFRPHITAKPHGEVAPGEHLRFTQVALIDMHPPAGAGTRAVVATWELRLDDA
jgi:2'-5' RNA ligase